MYGPGTIDERFTGRTLDLSVWTPAYLPAWSSTAEAAGTYAVDDEGLHLSIPADQQRWCPDQHDGALRVSGVQSGTWSGPVGSTRGQQPFRDGLQVREEQVTRWGFTPHFGRVEVDCRATIGPGSMFSAWMVGLEDEPDRCGEICLVEVFGDTVRGGQIALGAGLHAFRDPSLVEEFSADPAEIDVSRSHRYAVDWTPTDVTFSVDGVLTKRLDQSPQYPMQLVLAVFDFPDQHPPPDLVPELVVQHVSGSDVSG